MRGLMRPPCSGSTARCWCCSTGWWHADRKRAVVSTVEYIVVAVVVVVSFCVSASAGLGGSLVLVPTLSLVLGPKEGVALAALLLASNNLVKLAAYRETLPYLHTLPVVLAVIVGSAVGAKLLVSALASTVSFAVVGTFVLTLLAERAGWFRVQRANAPLLGFAAGATSGFSGTSGPLKGVALRNLGLDRQHMVGAASLVSLAGDATKSALFAEANLLDAQSARLAIAMIPVMIASTFAGRRINRRLGETGYAGLFWVVMGGYSVRLLLA